MQAGSLVIHSAVSAIHRVPHDHFLTLQMWKATVRPWGWVWDVIMAHKRVLLLGPTGVDKAMAIQRVGSFIKKEHGHAIRYVDFEREFLKPLLPKFGHRTFFAFLMEDSNQQAVIWKTAWDKCANAFDGEIIILGLHAAYVNTTVGLRCPINLPSICESFKPSLVISMIDDVPNMWFRTEKRAEGKEARGRPSFEQLLTARRAEQLLGDMVVTHSTGFVRHVALATSNAVHALANLIIFDANVTYLSFPISAPRRMEANGDERYKEVMGEVNELHHLALGQMQKDHERSFVTPLAIDEFPMVKKWEKAQADWDRQKAAGAADLAPLVIGYSDIRDRWKQSDLWGSEEVAILPPVKDEFGIPAEQIESVAGFVETDIGWRDRRLVLQSQSLAIHNPYDPVKGVITRGVKTEIEAATAAGVSSFYWQNPKWDPQDYVSTQFAPAGSMGPGASEALVQKTESLEALVQEKL